MKKWKKGREKETKGRESQQAAPKPPGFHTTTREPKRARSRSSSGVQHGGTSGPEDWISAFGRRHPLDCAPPEVVPVECSFVLGSSQRFTILPSVRVDQPLHFHEGQIHPQEAARTGWFALRQVFRSWGITCQEQFTEWLRREGFQAHSQGTTSVLGHRMRCSVEYVLRMRGWLCSSQFSWPWCCMWESNQGCHLEVLRQQHHHQTPFPCLRGGHSWTQWTFKRSCWFVFPCWNPAPISFAEGSGKVWQWHCVKGIEPSWRTMSWGSERGNSSVWSLKCCCTDLATQAVWAEMNWPGASRNSNRDIGCSWCEKPMSFNSSQVQRPHEHQKKKLRAGLWQLRADFRGDRCQELVKRWRALHWHQGTQQHWRPFRDNTRKAFAKCLRESLAGCSPGPGGCTNEMLRVCLDDLELFRLLFSASGDLARGTVPSTVGLVLVVATMTALQKPDGGLRGIATGMAFRRLVAKCLARQFGKTVETVCSPFRFACPQERRQIAWATSSERWLMPTLPWQWLRLMAWELTITCIGARCWPNFWKSWTPRPLAIRKICLRGDHHIRVGGPRGGPPPHQAGRRRWARGPAHAPVVQSGCAQRIGGRQKHDGSRWTLAYVFGWHVHLVSPTTSATLVQLHAGKTRDPRTSTTWVKKFGVRREGRCWGLQVHQKRSSELSQTGGGTQIVERDPVSAWFAVRLAVVAASRAEDCAPRQSEPGTQQDMTKGCSKPWRHCWAPFLAQRNRSRQHGTSPHFQWDWEIFVFGPRDELHLALTGHRGPMLCQCWETVCLQQRKSWHTWVENQRDASASCKRRAGFWTEKASSAGQVGRSWGLEPDPSSSHCGHWGMGTWLAVLRVLRFRTPLSGDRSACQIMPRRPGSLEVALRHRFRSGSPRFAHRSRVPSATIAVPDTRIGEVSAPTDPDWDQVRVWRPERYFWKTPGRLPTVWQVEKTCRAHRENFGPSVPRGRRDSHPQCQIAGHERASPGNWRREIEVVAAGLSIHRVRS